MTRSTHMRAALALAAILLLISTVSCRGKAGVGERARPTGPATISAADDSAKMPAADAKPYHSPFVVALDGSVFDTVTFKDVGLPRDGDGPDELLLETIAESFARQVSSHEALGHEAHVIYDEEILDPANHLHCERDHLYVDVWQGSAPRRWGYSLWSGCSDLDNFAWREIPDEASDERLIAWVTPLTSSIVDELASAAARGCFQKHC